MNMHTEMKGLLAAVLLAASAMAGAQATGDRPAAPPVPTQGSNDAMVAPAAASKQAREIAQGDPARWHREDVTAQQQWRTRQKEIGAALDEAKRACGQGAAAQRSSCLKAAQQTYKEEMAAARAEATQQPENATR